MPFIAISVRYLIAFIAISDIYLHVLPFQLDILSLSNLPFILCWNHPQAGMGQHNIYRLHVHIHTEQT